MIQERFSLVDERFMADFAFVENDNAGIKFFRMSLNFKNLILYVSGMTIVLIAFYRFENFPPYEGTPIARISPGIYNIVKQKCMHSQVEFDYTKPIPEDQIFSKQAVSFLALYGGSIIRKVIVTQNEMSWVVGNQNCLLFVRRTIKQNDNGKLILFYKSTLDKVPSNCTLHYRFKDKFYEENFESEINESLELNSSLIGNKIFKKEDGLLLYDEGYDDHSELGCLSNDRLITHLEQIQSFN